MVCEKLWDVKFLWKFSGLVSGFWKIKIFVEGNSLRIFEVLYSV